MKKKKIAIYYLNIVKGELPGCSTVSTSSLVLRLVWLVRRCSRPSHSAILELNNWRYSFKSLTRDSPNFFWEICRFSSRFFRNLLIANDCNEIPVRL